MATFTLTNWLSENRETVIAKFNKMTEEKFYNGITLKSFMVEVMKGMEMNNPKSANRAASLLPFVMGQVYVDNSKVVAEDRMTDYLRNKYKGTAYMALV